MMPAATHFDPVVGVDVHMVQPSGPVPPTPIPHPYIGIVFDPFDYLPIIGSTVKINGMHRAIAGTAGKALPKHFPIGGTFVPPLPADEHENFMGSSTVEMDGDAAAYLALPCLSCQSIGMPPPPRQSKTKKKGTIESLVLPTSLVLAIPKGAPVLIGGTPTISLFSAAMHLVGPLAKAIRRSKAFRKGAAAFKKARRRAFRNMKPGFLKCKVLRAEPVDVVTGEVVVDQQDFELPGRIPIRWTRHYRSGSTRRGICGAGWETPADARLELAEDGVVFHDGTGIASFFDALPDAEPVSEPVDGGRLHRLDRHYAVELKGGLTYYFDVPAAPAGEIPIAAIVDRSRNSLHFVRNGEGLREVVESAGRRLVCTSEGGLLRSITLHHPDFPERRRLVRFAYDAADNLTAVYDALDHPYTFGFDDRHRLIRHTNRTGLSFYYEYDAESRCVHSWGDGGLYDYHFAYDPIGRFNNLTDSLGHPWTVEYDERLLITRETDPLSGVTSYAYDEVGRTTAVVDPMGHATAYEYDERGNLVKLTRPDGTTITCEYDQNDMPVRTTDPNGAVWEQRWDDRGLLIKRQSPLGSVTAYQYDHTGLPIGVTDARQAATRFSFDRDGYLVAMIDALGNTTRLQHDELGNVLARTDPLGHTTRYRYDRKSRLIETILPGDACIRCAYDAQDNLIHYEDENGARTRFESFGQGLVKKRHQPDGHEVEYHYDTEEQLIGVTNQRGETYRFTRDALGRVIEEVDYWGQPTTYRFDPAGHLQQSTDPLGRAIDYTTDTLGRIRRKAFADPKPPGNVFEETFDFDATGNLVGCANEHVRVRRKFDAEGRLLEEKQGDFVIRNSFDELGNRIKREISTGNTVAYGFDPLGQAETIRINDELPITIERDAAGQVCKETLGPALERHYTYNAEGRLIAQGVKRKADWLFHTQYEYDAAGNLTHRRDSHDGIDRYCYDPLGQIVEHIDPQGKLKRFFQDPAGGRLQPRIVEQPGRRVVGGETPGTWFREERHEGMFYRFDRAGNLVERRDEGGVERRVEEPKAIMLTWDANQRLVRSRTNGVETSYGYDPLGRRVFKQTGTRRTQFGWDGDAMMAECVVDTMPAQPPTPQLLAESETMGKTHSGLGHVKEYVYYPDSFVPLALLQHTTDEVGAWTDQTFHYHTEPNGCPTRLTRANGDIAWATRCGVWGKPSELLFGEVANPIMLLGQYRDEETGLHYTLNRYYDPDCGQFVSPDPIGFAGGDLLYVYGPNVFAWSDPVGLSGRDLSGYQLSNRHFLNSLSIPKKTGNSIFYGSREQAHADLAEIHDGRTRRDGEHYITSSGRTWGVHNNSIHPVAGPNIINITSPEYNLLKAAKTRGSQAAIHQMEHMYDKGILNDLQVRRVNALMGRMIRTGMCQ